MLEQIAVSSAGPSARLAARILCGRLRRPPAGNVAAVARLMTGARDERVAAMAEEALALAWGSDQKVTNRVWDTLTATPGPAWRFLLAPAPDCPHKPRVRLVTAPPDGRRVLAAALKSADPELRGATADLLRATDHPILLADFESALGSTPKPLREPMDGKLEARAVLDLALTNTHLCQPAPLGGYRAGLAIVAILKRRFDLLDSYDPASLVDELVCLDDRAFPAPAAEGYRRWLRALGPGPGRERLCELVTDGYPGALAAIADSGQEPDSPDLLPAFLFCIEQWERYDALDPDGALLENYIIKEGDDAGMYLWTVAERNGRQLPAPRGFADPGF
ncbi:hypothetical protein MCAG_02701 [Micromonospora sp. ATCC 39149]|uniref:Uncharacterized protein n=1 Tax=Micromonospora carbonacea TaxID=47853 RepID=A0A7D6C5Y7_9ACTN|nr:hypothetical protein [Micromonospora sp. ATCC 39149]EEP72374.1 hypothetical protein MCAG_02701 [Micromonospora sp. ATCC 39149]QLJ98526.1 hypothetical protein HZU44_28390 [Micromonospora carbonacea]